MNFGYLLHLGSLDLCPPWAWTLLETVAGTCAAALCLAQRLWDHHFRMTIGSGGWRRWAAQAGLSVQIVGSVWAVGDAMTYPDHPRTIAIVLCLGILFKQVATLHLDGSRAHDLNSRKRAIE
jgi:hypothetical protein